MRRIVAAADVGCSLDTESVGSDAGRILPGVLSVEIEPVPL